MKKNSKKIPKIWIINQFANTPNMPGGTRHYEIGKYFAKLNWDVEVFSSDFKFLMCPGEYLNIKFGEKSLEYFIPSFFIGREVL